MKMKLTVPCVALALGAFMLTGCGADSNVKATASPAAQTAKEPNAAAKAIAAAPMQSYSGRYIGSGGGGAIPQVQALLDAYAHPEMTWQLSDVGSDAGLTLVQQGDLVDLSFVSRDLKPDEIGKVQSIPIGVVATGLVVNASNPVKNLSKEQVRQIFAGEITDWSQVGGKPGKIRVLVREKVASTRANFESYFFGGKATYAPEAIEVLESGEMLNTVRSFSNAIGMMTVTSAHLADPTISMMGIDGVAATKENVLGRTYKVSRPLHLVFRSDTENLKPGVLEFMNFVKSPEGQKVLVKTGL